MYSSHLKNAEIVNKDVFVVITDFLLSNEYDNTMDITLPCRRYSEHFIIDLNFLKIADIVEILKTLLYLIIFYSIVTRVQRCSMHFTFVPFVSAAASFITLVNNFIL